MESQDRNGNNIIRSTNTPEHHGEKSIQHTVSLSIYMIINCTPYLHNNAVITYTDWINKRKNSGRRHQENIETKLPNWECKHDCSWAGAQHNKWCISTPSPLLLPQKAKPHNQIGNKQQTDFTLSLFQRPVMKVIHCTEKPRTDTKEAKRNKVHKEHTLAEIKKKKKKKEIKFLSGIVPGQSL